MKRPRCSLLASLHLENLLHDLLLLDEKGAGDALANRAGGEDAAVRASHALLVLRHVLAAVLDRRLPGNLFDDGTDVGLGGRTSAHGAGREGWTIRTAWGGAGAAMHRREVAEVGSGGVCRSVMGSMPSGRMILAGGRRRRVRASRATARRGRVPARRRRVQPSRRSSRGPPDGRVGSRATSAPRVSGAPATPSGPEPRP